YRGITICRGDNKPEAYERASKAAFGRIQGTGLSLEVRIRPVCDCARPGRSPECEDDRGYLRVSPTSSRGKDRSARASDERGLSGWRSELSSRNSPRKSSTSWTRPSERESPESFGRSR